MNLKQYHLVKGCLKAGHSGLSTAVDLVSGHPAEVGAAGDRVLQLLDLVKVVGHGGQLADIAHQVTHVECRWEGGDCLEKVDPGVRSPRIGGGAVLSQIAACLPESSLLSQVSRVIGEAIPPN